MRQGLGDAPTSIGVTIMILIIIIVVLIIGYYLNYRNKYKNALANKLVEERGVEIIQEIKFEIYQDIKSIIEDSINGAKNYDKGNSDVSVSQYRNDIADKFKKIKNSFNYKNIKITDDEKHIFDITKKLSLVNPLYGEEKLEDEIKNFKKGGEENVRE